MKSLEDSTCLNIKKVIKFLDVLAGFMVLNGALVDVIY